MVIVFFPFADSNCAKLAGESSTGETILSSQIRSRLNSICMSIEQKRITLERLAGQ